MAPGPPRAPMIDEGRRRRASGQTMLSQARQSDRTRTALPSTREHGRTAARSTGMGAVGPTQRHHPGASSRRAATGHRAALPAPEADGPTIRDLAAVPQYNNRRQDHTRSSPTRDTWSMAGMSSPIRCRIRVIKTHFERCVYDDMENQ